MGTIIDFNKINKKKKTLNDILNRTNFEDIDSIFEYYINKSINTPDIDDDMVYILNFDLVSLKYYDIDNPDINNKIVSLYNKVHASHKNDELLYASVLTSVLVNSGEEIFSEDTDKILGEVNKKLKKKELN